VVGCIQGAKQSFGLPTNLRLDSRSLEPRQDGSGRRLVLLLDLQPSQGQRQPVIRRIDFEAASGGIDPFCEVDPGVQFEVRQVFVALNERGPQFNRAGEMPDDRSGLLPIEASVAAECIRFEGSLVLNRKTSMGTDIGLTEPCRRPTIRRNCSRLISSSVACWRRTFPKTRKFSFSTQIQRSRAQADAFSATAGNNRIETQRREDTRGWLLGSVPSSPADRLPKPEKMGRSPELNTAPF
jgi:hypothetical protein